MRPGTATSISFKIENNSGVSKSYRLSIKTSSSGIAALLAGSSVVVEAHSVKIYLVPLRIAPDMPKGSYTVSLTSSDDNGNTITRSQELEILGVRKLTLTPASAPDYVKAGEKITATFLAKNNGNMPESISLDADNATIAGGPEITMMPGETRIITIFKNTDATIGATAYQSMHLAAILDTANRSDVYKNVRIIPIAPKEEDIYYRFPVAASLSYIGSQNRGNDQSGFQGEIYGKGSLSKADKDMLEFHAVTKNPAAFNAFTPYEEYFIDYKGKGLYAHLGDKNYSASYLTEFARYGRGAELSYTFNKITLGGFYDQPRFFRDIKGEFDVYSKYKFSRQSEITAGYLYKTPLGAANGVSLPYITATTKIFKNIALQGEAAYSKNKDTTGTAFMAQAQGYFKKSNFGLTYMKASSEFAGYFTNSHSVIANTAYTFSKKINFSANYRQDAKNYKKDTLFGTAPYEQYFQSGLQYNYSQNTSLMFLGGFQKYEDQMPVKQFDYDESFLKTTLNQGIGIFKMELDGQVGKTNNYLYKLSGISQLYAASLGFEKFRTNVSLYASYAQTSRYQVQDQKNIYYGARVMSRFSEHSNLSIFYQNNYMPEELYSDQNLFEVRYHQQIARNHELDFSGRYTLQHNQIGGRDFILALRYTWRINVPVKKIASYVSLTGNIANLGVQKTDGIKVYLGNHVAVTDQNGNFVFKNITPGEYYLDIDRNSVDITDIADATLPAALQLKNKENAFDFALTKAAKIDGSVQMNEGRSNYSYAQFPAQKNKKNADNIIVEASNGEQVFRKIVTIGESFDFTYLRPGRWEVKIYKNGLDKRYKVDNDIFDFVLHPGETKQIAIKILKQQREIKYQTGLSVSYNSENGK